MLKRLVHYFLSSLIFYAITFAINAEHLNQAVPSCSALNNSQLLDEHSGKVLLIDFWATWCGPCHKAIPFLNTLHHELKDKGFEVIAINVDEDASEVPAFLRRYPVDYPMLFDATGECPTAFNVQVMPSSYLIDKSGKLQYIHKGFRNKDREWLRSTIEAAVELEASDV